MTQPAMIRAIGLMSGTSMDGIDAAVLETDGESVGARGPSLSVSYDPGFRARLRGVLGREDGSGEVTAELTRRHAAAVRRLLDMAGPAAVSVIGFHGHTVLHDPAHRRTVQIGDGNLLAAETGIDVVCDFRSADVAAGGQGAPLASLYHRALFAGQSQPFAVLNLGGVGNVTWFGADGGIGAFDTGPANALIDDWTAAHTDKAYDADGALAAAGRVDEDVVADLLRHPYFDAAPPKSLDRDDFAGHWRYVAGSRSLSPADGAATLSAFTVRSVARGREHMAQAPRRWLVTGGGRHNPVLMAMLNACLGVPVEPVEAAGADGDALEAEAFAFLAVRSLRGLPLSLPETTGVAHPCPGGALCRAPGARRRA